MGLQVSVSAEIARIVRDDPANRLPGTEEPFFDSPLVGFAAATDPLFDRYQEIIGPFHWTPVELFEAEYGTEAPAPRTVVTWVLPITEATRKSNGREERFPSRSWAHTRNFGEKFNDVIRRGVVAFLEEKGFRAVAPLLCTNWKALVDPTVGLASTWSERHAAFAAGLGTFSLNDGLITERGIAHRLGSVVTDAPIPATPVEHGDDHRSNCAFYTAKGCGVCIGRCPVGAVSEQGHDKDACREYSYGTVLDEVGERFGVDIAGCGLCQTKVPCEKRIPPVVRER